MAKLHDLSLLLHPLQSVCPALKIDQMYFIEAKFSLLRILMNQIAVENLIRDNRRTSGSYFTQAVSVGWKLNTRSSRLNITLKPPCHAVDPDRPLAAMGETHSSCLYKHGGGQTSEWRRGRRLWCHHWDLGSPQCCPEGRSAVRLLLSQVDQDGCVNQREPD